MRRISLCVAALILLMSASSYAGEWIQYASKTDLFGVNFPAEPKVQDITYTTEYRIDLPARLYTAGGRSESLLRHRRRLQRRGENPHCSGRTVQEERRRGRCLPERVAVRRAGLDRQRVVEVLPAKRQGHAFRMVRRGPGRRTSAATDERRWFTNLRRNPQTRHPSLHSRGDRFPLVRPRRDCFNNR